MISFDTVMKAGGDGKPTKMTYKNNLSTRIIFDVPLFSSSINSLLKLIDDDKLGEPVWIATVNPEFIMSALKDGHFLRMLNEKTTVNVIDGVGVIWALKVRQFQGLKRWWVALHEGLKILGGTKGKWLIPGVELMDRLCAVASKNKQSVYFFGGWGNRSQRTAEYFVKKYPGLKVAGARAEDFDFKAKIDYLFVARAMKRQEEWIEKYFDRLNVKVVMGVGRSFDYLSGELRRAPGWIRKMGLEWLFSLIVEPKRWKRQLELPKFIWKVMVE